ncbi:membrane associated rhomboid family serine protease [Tahibacter aquaticus]|uniref:Membrane associated rhomboid family serine protease n=1 Tax=Tahibacter aquaticus TaxID=520092 RepID=A0A4R6Z2L6_9GAMM|nr:rhomboid family intramembrane serine protease [Tahibacter aquaticus]TDR45858.1 membrane associated rhomboid family serine protease [Tahibacter aquaticus]
MNSSIVVVVWLVILNAVMFTAQLFLGDKVLLYLALWPPGDHVVASIGTRTFSAGFQPLQLLSYGFLHGDFFHIGINLIGLVLFGPLLERCMGAGHFLFYYCFCLVCAGVAQLLVGLGDAQAAATIGASGAIYGLLAAAASLYPERKLLLIPLPGELEARTLAWLLAGISVLHGVFGTNAGVAHFAHLGGMLGGYLLVQYWRGRLPIQPNRILEP